MKEEHCSQILNKPERVNMLKKKKKPLYQGGKKVLCDIERPTNLKEVYLDM